MYDIDTPEGMEEAKAWMHALLSQITDGGKWIVPRSGSVYTINHQTKTAHRAGYLPDPAIDRVLREMGWAVFDPQQH